MNVKFKNGIVLCNFYFVECFLLYFLLFDPFIYGREIVKILFSFCTFLIVKNEIFFIFDFRIEESSLKFMDICPIYSWRLLWRFQLQVWT